MEEKKILVSGMRPTGSLHLGHYFGVLQNWLQFQEISEYQCYFFIADWHSLTTKTTKKETKELPKYILEVLKDFLACGIDPEKSVLYLQSDLKEIAELSLLLSMLTPQSWIEKDPTLKDLVKSSSQALSHGMLGYPILQAADILVMNGELVPVGKDQEAHLEISRKIAKRFNFLYESNFFKEPEALFTSNPKIKGTDGEKMSKSRENDLKLSDSSAETLRKVKTMKTDPKRVTRKDPGNPGDCQTVFYFYEMLLEANDTRVKRVSEECKAALRGCMACKEELSEIISKELLSEFREKRASLEKELSEEELREILRVGGEKARQRASQNLEEVKKIMSVA